MQEAEPGAVWQSRGMGWGAGGRVQRDGTYVYLWLIHVAVWQKPTQHCKTIILQWKIKNENQIKTKQNIYLLLSVAYHVSWISSRLLVERVLRFLYPLKHFPSALFFIFSKIFSLSFFLYVFLHFSWRLITLQYCAHTQRKGNLAVPLEEKMVNKCISIFLKLL